MDCTKIIGEKIKALRTAQEITLISPKTKCNPFSKRFVQFSLLLAQNEM